MVDPDEVELLLALRGLGALDFLVRLSEGHADAVLGGAALCSSRRLAPIAGDLLGREQCLAVCARPVGPEQRVEFACYTVPNVSAASHRECAQRCGGH